MASPQTSFVPISLRKTGLFIRLTKYFGIQQILRPWLVQPEGRIPKVPHPRLPLMALWRVRQARGPPLLPPGQPANPQGELSPMRHLCFFLTDNFRVSGGVTRGSVMTPAAIIGIVAMSLVVISVPLIFLVTRHYRRSRQGIRVRRDRLRRRPTLMPPTPVPFTTPWYSTTAPIGEEAFPLKSSRHGSEGTSFSRRYNIQSK